MVYIKKEGIQPKKERFSVTGKLVSISADPGAVVNEDKQEFRYIDIAIVDETKEEPVWYNIRASGTKETVKDPQTGESVTKVRNIVINELPELKKADELLRAGKKPKVEAVYYISIKEARDENGEIIIKDGKAVKYENKKASLKDLESFKVLEDDITSVE
ncbi:MAG: hypothetical protein D6734_08655 [Candidatus Schekmanbacteria bacterium]|nr:MAG: hypothetical protein D6734_08655 [Candidatus Schekmanbacteria bacterium]